MTEIMPAHCDECGRLIVVKEDGTYRRHPSTDFTRTCPTSGTPVPAQSPPTSEEQ